MSEVLLHGIGVSPGIAAGPAVVIRRDLPEIPERIVSLEAVDDEVRRLHDAVDSVRRGLEDLRRRAGVRVGPEEAKIFDARILMLEDAEFLRSVERLIRENQHTAERAFEINALEVRALWAASGSDRLRDRVTDLSALQLRVLNALLGHAVDDLLRPDTGQPAIIFTRELTPFLTVEFERDHVIGFVSVEGTRTSHAAILARSLGIPCVMGLTGAIDAVRTGAQVIVDGTNGTVTVEPTDAEAEAALELAERRKCLLEELEASAGQPTDTLDGVAVSLCGNLDLPEELGELARNGARGVGLLRTEFLIVGRAGLPSEAEQLDYFRRVVHTFPDDPVVVRSYDVGGDKFPAAFRIHPEANPFLGWRALRVCLDHPDLFLTQLRALLRARIDGDIRLMLPLVVGVEEVTESRALMQEARDGLLRDGLRAAADLPVGVMVETPAAAAIADRLTEVSDFLSVGTNDLTQYTLAVDRGNARLAKRFTALHPAVVRMLDGVRRAATAGETPVSVCGELASEPLGAFLLLGLGYRTLSVSPSALPMVRWLLRQFDAADAARAAEEALEARTAADVRHALQAHLAGFIDLKTLASGWLPEGAADTTLQ